MLNCNMKPSIDKYVLVCKRHDISISEKRM